MSSGISPPMTVAVLLAALVATAAEPSPNTWRKLDKATIEGRRHDVPLGYCAGPETVPCPRRTHQLRRIQEAAVLRRAGPRRERGQMGELVPSRQGLGSAVRPVPGARLEERNLRLQGRGRERPPQLDRVRHLFPRPEVRLRSRRQMLHLLRRRPYVPLRPCRAPVDRPGAEDRSGEGTRRHPPLEFDVLRPPEQAVRPLRRRQHPERARRSRHVDLLAGRQRLDAAEARRTTAAAGQLPARVRPGSPEGRPVRRRPAGPIALRYMDF